MSELINTHDNRAAIRWKLLTSASALALTVSLVSAAKAEDTDRPLIWIELGGQAESMSGQGAPFAPDFLTAYSTSAILQEKVTPLQAQKLPLFGFGEEASIAFQPENSDWVFSASARIGRSSNTRHVDHQTNKLHAKYQSGLPEIRSGYVFTQANFADTKVQNRQSHSILDFSAGKDVGLGMFGRDSSSVLSLGVRFAQFTSKETFDIRARPDLQFKYYPSAAAPTHILFPYFHTYHATGHSSRSFRGVGPSLSWNGSAPFAGNPQGGEIAFDWGVNAALLFGKQKARVRHQETGRYQSIAANFNHTYATVYHNAPPTSVRSRSVTVPNIGGFAGLSYRYSDAKISIGYRYDTFLQAMDTGIDAAKKSNVTFNGPYASISIGLGD